MGISRRKFSAVGVMAATAALLLSACGHVQRVDRALHGRCLAACEGWQASGVVAMCGVDGGCTCMAWEGDMVRLEGACAVQVPL